MSWLDKIKNDLIITTGDGTVFKPNWINATKEIEYNVAQFEFIEIAGTLISRGKPKGRKYNLEIYFQGDFCIEDAELFDLSARDPRPWKISHPFYGDLTVQPLGLLFDNSKYNVSKITGTVLETLTEDSPKGTVDPVDKINYDKSQLDLVVINSYVTFNPQPVNTDVNQLTDNITKIYNAGLPNIKLDIDASNYFNLFSAALAAVLTLANDAFNAMTLVKDMINAPIQFVNSVKNRIAALTSQFVSLRNSINNLADTASILFNRNTKKSYENNGAEIVSAAAVAAVTNMDYGNRQDVINIIESILALYNQYLSDLDSFQTPTGGAPDSYIPDADSLIGLSALVNFTISSLFTVALNSKQERAIYCETDTNLISLAHRLYGLTADDATINTLAANNNLGLNQILQIKKDTKIIWYV